MLTNKLQHMAWKVKARGAGKMRWTVICPLGNVLDATQLIRYCHGENSFLGICFTCRLTCQHNWKVKQITVLQKSPVDINV